MSILVIFVSPDLSSPSEPLIELNLSISLISLSKSVLFHVLNITHDRHQHISAKNPYTPHSQHLERLHSKITHRTKLHQKILQLKSPWYYLSFRIYKKTLNYPGDISESEILKLIDLLTTIRLTFVSQCRFFARATSLFSINMVCN